MHLCPSPLLQPWEPRANRLTSIHALLPPLFTWLKSTYSSNTSSIVTSTDASRLVRGSLASHNSETSLCHSRNRTTWSRFTFQSLSLPGRLWELGSLRALVSLQLFIRHLLSAGHYSRCCGYSNEQNKVPAPKEFTFQQERAVLSYRMRLSQLLICAVKKIKWHHVIVTGCCILTGMIPAELTLTKTWMMKMLPWEECQVLERGLSLPCKSRGKKVTVARPWWLIWGKRGRRSRQRPGSIQPYWPWWEPHTLCWLE